MSNINFKGGFLIEKPEDKVWKRVQKDFPRRKCLFESYNDNGDKFIAVKTLYDKPMVGLLLKNKLRFKFYPEINLKSRLDTYFPEESRKIVDAQTKVIDNEKELIEFSKVTDEKPKISKYRWKPNDHIDKTYKALELDEKECCTDIVNGITFIRDKKGNLLAKASPNNERGVNFVYKYPKNSDDSSRRFALSQSGETEDFGPLQIISFQKLFMKNVKIDTGRIRPMSSKKNDPV